MWVVDVAFADFPDVTENEEQTDALLDALGGTFIYNSILRVLTLHWDEGATFPDVGSLERKARDFLRVLKGHGDEEIIEIRVRDRGRPTETSNMYRYADMAQWSGKSRQYIAQLAGKDPDFPAPVNHLSDGTPLFAPMAAMHYIMKKFPEDNTVRSENSQGGNE